MNAETGKRINPMRIKATALRGVCKAAIEKTINRCDAVCQQNRATFQSTNSKSSQNISSLRYPSFL